MKLELFFYCTPGVNISYFNWHIVRRLVEEGNFIFFSLKENGILVHKLIEKTNSGDKPLLFSSSLNTSDAVDAVNKSIQIANWLHSLFYWDIKEKLERLIKHPRFPSDDGLSDEEYSNFLKYGQFLIDIINNNNIFTILKINNLPIGKNTIKKISKNFDLLKDQKFMEEIGFEYFKQIEI